MTPLPRSFHLWWLATTASATGNAMLGFAMIWSATAHGTGTVALVSTVAAVPQILLVLIGGAIGDRHGPRRTLLGTSIARILMLAAALVPSLGDPSAALLVLATAGGAVIAAVHQPSASVLPRLLVRDPEQLPRAMAHISGSLQIARTLGVATGGLAVAVWSLAAVIALNLALMLLVLGLLLVMRPLASSPGPAARSRDGMLRSLLDGLRVARDLRIWPLLAAVALISGAVLPTIGVVLPVLARGRGWSGAQAGLLDAGYALGVLAVTFAIGVLGAVRSPRVALTGGPLLVALGSLLLALPLPLIAAILVCGAIGAGTALFTTCVAPMLVRWAPADQMTRFQSLLVLVQLVPPAALNGAFAWLGAQGGALPALLPAALMAVSAAVLGRRLRTESVRTA